MFAGPPGTLYEEVRGLSKYKCGTTIQTLTEGTITCWDAEMILTDEYPIDTHLIRTEE